MRIKYTKTSKPTEIHYEDFAREYELELVVGERTYFEVEWLKSDRGGGAWEYYAYFDNLYISEDGGLAGLFGNGSTAEKAIADYISRINNQRAKYNGEYIDIPTLFV